MTRPRPSPAPGTLTAPEAFAHGRQRRDRHRAERRGEIAWFNLRQAHVVAGEPSAMQLALRAALGPPETKRPPGGAVVEGNCEAALRDDERTPRGAAAQRPTGREGCGE